eukprot:COSAG01_NODE_2130_length_8363_cov_5.120523_6_plen_224_part_00
MPDSCAFRQMTESPALLFCSKININYTRTGVAASGGRNEGVNVPTTEPSDAPAAVEDSDIELDFNSDDFGCQNDDSGGDGVSANAGEKRTADDAFGQHGAEQEDFNDESEEVEPPPSENDPLQAPRGRSVCGSRVSTAAAMFDGPSLRWSVVTFGSNGPNERVYGNITAERSGGLRQKSFMVRGCTHSLCWICLPALVRHSPKMFLLCGWVAGEMGHRRPKTR